MVRLRIGYAIVCIGLLCVGCGLIPGTDKAGEASVPEFPLPTAPEELPPDAATELFRLAERRAASTTTSPEASSGASGELPEAAGGGEDEALTGGVDVLSLSEQCFDLLRLRLIGFQLFNEAPFGTAARRLSLIQQVDTTISELSLNLSASQQARWEPLHRDFVALTTTIDAGNPRKFEVAFVEYMNVHRGDFVATFTDVERGCPALSGLGGDGRLALEPPSAEELSDYFLEKKVEPEVVGLTPG